MKRLPFAVYVLTAAAVLSLIVAAMIAGWTLLFIRWPATVGIVSVLGVICLGRWTWARLTQ